MDFLCKRSLLLFESLDLILQLSLLVHDSIFLLLHLEVVQADLLLLPIQIFPLLIILLHQLVLLSTQLTL